MYRTPALNATDFTVKYFFIKSPKNSYVYDKAVEFPVPDIFVDFCS